MVQWDFIKQCLIIYLSVGLLSAYKISCPHEEDRYVAKDKVLSIENYSFGPVSAATFEGIMMAVPYLDTVILRRTNITDIAPATFASLGGVRCLDLSRNSLVTLRRGMFQGFKELQTLILSDNHLIDILDNPFADLTHLKVLDLSQNLLSIISPTTFTSLVNLEELHLQSNYISILSVRVFEQLPSLKRIFLHKNPLQEDRGAFLALSQLHTLVLSYTQLRLVPPFPDSVKVLDLEGCQLTSLPGNVYRSKFLQLDSLWLSNNPWYCNCDMSWIKPWHVANKSVVDFDQLKCEAPEAVYSVPFKDAFQRLGCVMSTPTLSLTSPVTLNKDRNRSNGNRRINNADTTTSIEIGTFLAVSILSIASCLL